MGRKGVKKRCSDKWRDTLPPIYLFCILDSSSHLLYLHSPTNNRNQYSGQIGHVRSDRSRQQEFLLLSEIKAFMMSVLLIFNKAYLSKIFVEQSLIFLPPTLLNWVI